MKKIFASVVLCLLLLFGMTVAVGAAEYVYYENDFSDPNTIADFTQYRGKWSIKDGRLYYSETTSGFKETTNFSFILYSGNHDANLLRNYTLDVDVYNTQTATGVLTHADLAQATSDNDAAFYGFTGCISNNATLGATGYASWEGKYGTNYSVSEALLTPGSNYHLRMVHADGTFTFTITPIGSDEVIWSDTQLDGDWPTGTFGFRMRVALDEKVSVGNTSFDNLKITVHGKQAVLLNAGYHPNAEVVGELAAPSVTLKMTLGKTDYTLNGETKTMDVAPIIRNDRTMLPVRYVAEALGAEIAWDGATSTATLKTADTEIKITVGAKDALVNGKSVALDSPAFIENDRTYMPVRFVAETLGGTVAWDGATSTATITK